MKPRHLILIVLIGMSLIAMAPAPEKAGQADKTEPSTAPARDVKIVPSDKATVEPASFAGDARKLKEP